MATIFGVGVLFKAEKCVTAATKGAKFSVKASTVAMTLDGGIAATRIGQGIYSVGWHGGDGALGYFGDAFLRLAGVSAQAIKRLRGPYCFVAGTPVHTEDGMRAVEEVQVGSRVWVWGYDRGRQSWGLCVVTGASRTDAVRVVVISVECCSSAGENWCCEPSHPLDFRANRHFIGKLISGTFASTSTPETIFPIKSESPFASALNHLELDSSRELGFGAREQGCRRLETSSKRSRLIAVIIRIVVKSEYPDATRGFAVTDPPNVANSE